MLKQAVRTNNDTNIVGMDLIRGELFREFKGKFVEIISKKGFVELVDPPPWIKVKAKFRIMERNTLGPLQKTHDVNSRGNVFYLNGQLENGKFALSSQMILIGMEMNLNRLAGLRT